MLNHQTEQGQKNSTITMEGIAAKSAQSINALRELLRAAPKNKTINRKHHSGEWAKMFEEIHHIKVDTREFTVAAEQEGFRLEEVKPGSPYSYLTLGETLWHALQEEAAQRKVSVFAETNQIPSGISPEMYEKAIDTTRSQMKTMRFVSTINRKHHSGELAKLVETVCGIKVPVSAFIAAALQEGGRVEPIKPGSTNVYLNISEDAIKALKEAAKRAESETKRGESAFGATIAVATEKLQTTISAPVSEVVKSSAPVMTLVQPAEKTSVQESQPLPVTESSVETVLGKEMLLRERAVEQEGIQPEVRSARDLSQMSISMDDRYRLIQESAFRRAKHRNFAPGFESQDFAMAITEVDYALKLKPDRRVP